MLPGDVLRPFSLYIHFPYCLTKCPYCDFTSYPTDSSSIPHVEYAEAVIKELSFYLTNRFERGRGRILHSIFLGGGTPSLWEPEEAGRVLAFIKSHCECMTDMEITLECNPTSFSLDHAKQWVGAGINRFSIGVQALKAEQLQFLGRTHGVRAAEEAVQGALLSGAKVSADLIVGLSGQPPDDACEQALRLCHLGLKHLSCYQLTVESGTRFGQLARQGKLPLAEESQVAETFLSLQRVLDQAGLSPYEISNFAVPGEEAQHNLAYWRGWEYLGVGCGAVGFYLFDSSPIRGVRYRNPLQPRSYFQMTLYREDPSRENNPLDIWAEELDALTLFKERLMLGLRLAEGIDVAYHADALGIQPWTEEREQQVQWLIDQRRLKREGDRLWIPREAWLWADDTAARLF
ncbi:hypothetical protein BCY86_04730 [Pajaroellobacter abortibovis]|uniref:Heme chaperone HemW n=1 Tax=Pajaroellobacter abortibovis TaxID=1882918 RepID=A0A1L6MZ91_9BACT|nr:hypothetical protein BCY86_04730 [Pajaroellobacter abortibovis]